MRSLLLAIVIGVAAALITGQLFRNAFERRIERRIEAIAVDSANAPQASSTETAPLPFTPPARTFRGPVGEPSVIGPYGPPPNR